MAEAGDLINEFKSAKPPERVVIVLGIIAVIAVAFYLYKRGQSASAASSSTQGATTGQQAGYPTANGVPVLPNGVNPLYDPNGNLVGYQNPPATGPGGTNQSSLPAILQGMEIWKGTTTGNYFFGPNGPQPGRANQTALSTLFPPGTVFSGGTGSPLSYTLPGTNTPINTGVILSNPTPQAPMISSNTQLSKTAGGITH